MEKVCGLKTLAEFTLIMRAVIWDAAHQRRFDYCAQNIMFKIT